MQRINIKRLKFSLILFTFSFCLFLLSIIIFNSRKENIVYREVNFSLDKYLYPVDNVIDISDNYMRIRFRVWKDILIEKKIILEGYNKKLIDVDKIINGKRLYLRTGFNESNGMLYGSILVVGLEGLDLASYLEKRDRTFDD